MKIFFVKLPRLFLGTVLASLLFFSSGAPVLAEEPVNEATVMFTTNWSYVVMNSDEFINQEVLANKSWNTSLSNTPDGSGLSVEQAALLFNAAVTFNSIFPQPSVSNHPDYMWNVGSVTEGASAWGYGCGAPMPPITASFVPGFNVSRTFNQTVFTSGNTTTQVLTLTVTPTSPEVDTLAIGVFPQQNTTANAVILSADMDPEGFLFISPDGKFLNATLTGLMPLMTTTLTVLLQIDPSVDELEYKPAVSVGFPMELISSGTQTDTTVSYTDPDSGIWTWASNETCHWNWETYLKKDINLPGVCMQYIPQVNNAEVQFIEQRGTGLMTDSFINGQVAGYRNFQSQISNTWDTIGQSIVTPAISIETSAAFETINTFPTALSQQYGPPVYSWTFADVSQGNNVGISVMKTGDNPYWFTPGYDVSREFSHTIFSQGSVETQTITLTITPRKPDMTDCRIDIVAQDETIADITIISPSPDPINGIIGDSEGHFRRLLVTGLNYNVPRVISIELAVESQIENLEYKPLITVTEISGISSGAVSGSFVTHVCPETGIWTWSASGDYAWEWSKQVHNTVNFIKVCQPFAPQVNNVDIGYTTYLNYSLTEDEFTNDEVEGQTLIGSSLQNTYDSTGEPVNAVSLRFDSPFEFGWIGTTPQQSGPPVYLWNFGIIPQNGMVNESLYKLLPETVFFTPGFDFERTIDTMVFTSENIQTITLSITPRNPDLTRSNVIIQLEDNENADAQFVSPVIDPANGIYGSNTTRIFDLAGLSENNEVCVTITLLISPKKPVVEYTPHIIATYSTLSASGIDTGNSTSCTMSEQGTFTWTAEGEYTWNWSVNQVIGLIYRQKAVELNTPAGTDITVQNEGTVINFSNVSQAGNTEVTVVNEPPFPGFGIEFLGTYYDITTTADYDGPVTLSIPYDDTGMTPEEEAALRLYHWNGSEWVDVTVLPVDTEANIVTGQVAALFWFGVGHELPIVTWLPPLANRDVYEAQVGSTVPVKFKLTDSNGNSLVFDDVQVLVTSNEGGYPVFQGEASYHHGSKTWRLNIKTKGWEPGEYTIRISVNPLETYQLKVLYKGRHGGNH